LTNHDLKPVEPERRQWGPWNFVGFWIADCFNINTWMISSSMVFNGLSWWQSWLCVWIGYSIAGCFIVLTGRIGATFHRSVRRSAFDCQVDGRRSVREHHAPVVDRDAAIADRELRTLTEREWITARHENDQRTPQAARDSR
jgi:hypothetical protein